MYCANCGAKQEENAAVCANCGAAVPGAQPPLQQPDSNNINDGPAPQQPGGGAGAQQPPSYAQPQYPSNTAQPYGAQMPPPAQSGTSGTWLIPNIIAAVLSMCCCQLGLVTSIIGIIFAAMVDGKRRMGDYTGAEKNISLSRVMFFVSLGLLVLGVIFWIAYFLFFAAMYPNPMSEIFEYMIEY